MSLLRKKPLLLGGLLVLALVVLPATIFFFQQQQVNKSNAEKTVLLSFSPNSTQAAPMQVPAGSTFTLDVYLDPGANSVSFVKTEINYDTSKFELAGGFIPNRDIFSQVVEGPLNTPGKLTTTLSIGSDLSKAVKTKTKIGTVALKVLSNAPANATANVTFGSGSQALSVSNNSNYDENVIANTEVATVQINKPKLTCGTSSTDAMLIMDRSGSMNDKAGSSSTKIASAQSAANSFIDILAAGTNDTAGLTSFSNTATLDSALTSSFSTVKSKVNALSANGGTCISCSINKANQEIAAHKRPGIKNVVILLTDGIANYVDNNNREVNASTAEQAALSAATAGHNQNGTLYFTIGLGQDVNSPFLTKIAEDNGGQYYFSPTTDDLNAIYSQISEILAGGSVSGTVFNDANGNGVFDANEAPLPGWLLQLYPSGSQSPQAITTDSNGTYSITNLCDGNYTIQQVQQAGWKQTVPTNASSYPITITNGNAASDKDFGNKNSARCSDNIDNDGNGYTDSADATCHTDGNPNNPSSYDPNKDGEHGANTCSDSKDNNGNGLIDGADPVCHTDGNPNNPGSYDPGLPELAPTSTPAPTATPTQTGVPTPTPDNSTSATLALNLFLHGIGSAGDNANPTGNSLSNKKPLHADRDATVWLYDTNNILVATGSGTVSYSSASGTFVGDILTSTSVHAGKYSVKVRTGTHLTRLLGGIQTLVDGQKSQMPDAQMVAGDINGDNKLDILDYNMLLDCYSDLQPAKACD